MKNFAEQVHAYHQYATQKVTKITYSIAIPLLLFAALIFFGWIHVSVPRLFSINLAWPFVLALLIYYYLFDVLLAAGLTVIFILMTVLAELISQPAINLAGFITFLIVLGAGILALWVGYDKEKKKPFFLDNLLLVLLAPLCLFAELMFALGYRQDLNEEVNKQINNKKIQ